MNDYPYWRLSGFYFAYFGVLGAMIPFWALFLQDRGFGLVEIALLMAIPMATRIVAPYLWGWIADHRGARLPVVRFGSLATILCFTSVWLADGFWSMALVMASFSFFWNAVLPQFEVVTLNHLGSRMAEYSRVRLWGSIGFILAVVGLGALFDVIAVAWLPACMLAIMVVMWATSLVTDETSSPPPVHHGDDGFRTLLREPVVWVFFLTCLLINLSHGPYYTYFSIHLQDLGWTRLGIGGLWALGVVAEVLVFIYMHRILGGMGAVNMLGVASVGLVVRWLLLAWLPESLAALLFAQALHAVTFGFFHAAGIHLIHSLFTGATQGRGQALFSSFSYGIGGSGGALAAAALWPAWGAGVAFTAMAGVGVVATLLVVFVLARHPLLQR